LIWNQYLYLQVINDVRITGDDVTFFSLKDDLIPKTEPLQDKIE